MAPHHEKNHGGEHQVHGVVQRYRAKFTAVHAALQNAPNQLLPHGDHFLAVERGQLRKITRLAQNELGDARGLGGTNAFPPHLKALAQQLAGAALEVLHRQAPFVKAPGNVVAYHRLEQFQLAGEIQKQRALRDAGPCRHFFHARGGKAFFHEQIQCSLQQLARACLFAAAAPPGSGWALRGIGQRLIWQVGHGGHNEENDSKKS